MTQRDAERRRQLPRIWAVLPRLLPHLLVALQWLASLDHYCRGVLVACAPLAYWLGVAGEGGVLADTRQWTWVQS